MTGNEPAREQATSLTGVHMLTDDGLLGRTAPSQRIPPTGLQKSLNNIPQYSESVDIPMQEIRYQNDTDRSRNKVRLQEKFEVNLYFISL